MAAHIPQFNQKINITQRVRCDSAVFVGNEIMTREHVPSRCETPPRSSRMTSLSWTTMMIIIFGVKQKKKKKKKKKRPSSVSTLRCSLTIHWSPSIAAIPASHLKVGRYAWSIDYYSRIRQRNNHFPTVINLLTLVFEITVVRIRNVLISMLIIIRFDA